MQRILWTGQRRRRSAGLTPKSAQAFEQTRTAPPLLPVLTTRGLQLALCQRRCRATRPRELTLSHSWLPRLRCAEALLATQMHLQAAGLAMTLAMQAPPLRLGCGTAGGDACTGVLGVAQTCCSADGAAPAESKVSLGPAVAGRLGVDRIMRLKPPQYRRRRGAVVSPVATASRACAASPSRCRSLPRCNLQC